MEIEHRIMAAQGAMMFVVLFLLAWQGGVHWFLAVLVALLLMPLVLVAVEGVRYYFESRAERGNDSAEKAGPEEASEPRAEAEPPVRPRDAD